MAIYFYDITGSTRLPAKRILKAYLRHLFIDEGRELKSLTYIFCSDNYLLKINKEFLFHDYYTDIVTFSLENRGEPIVGEVYISIERVRDNATLLSTHFITELHRVIFHGALHLCGYKDKSITQQKLMRAEEERHLSCYFRKTL